MIYIATTNYSRYKSLKRTLNLIDKKIKTKSIFRERIDSPKEDGKDEFEDVLIKAKYYSQKLKGYIMCEDDRIYIELKKDHSEIIKTTSLKVNGKLDYLKQYLDKYKVAKGIIVKAIVGCNNNNYHLEKVEIPVTFVPPAKKISNTTSNTLNYFTIPKGFLITFSEMREIDKQRFSEKYLQSPLERFLKEVKLGI